MNIEAITEQARKIPVVKKTDVVVAGGGVAGLSAAVSAARNGAGTILIERHGCLGGTLTECPMVWIGGYNEEVHGGIVKELIERLRACGGIGRTFYNSVIGGVMLEVDLNVFKMTSVSMLEEAGVKILLHALVAGSIVRDGAINGVIIESKSGRQAVLSKVVVDATGDGDVSVMAGASYQQGRTKDGKTQAMTLCGPTMENVNFNKLWHFITTYRKEHPKEIREFIGEGSVFAVSGFSGLIERAVKQDGFSLSYDTIWINGTKGGDRVELSGSFIPDVSGTDVFDLTYAETESLKQISGMINFAKKYIPGFEESRQMDRGLTAVGVRETRRIVGEYMLTEKEISAGKKFKDVIARNSTPMDMHNPEGNQKWGQVKPYDIPYGCLVPEKIDNLLTAGRCISVTHEALASVRFIPCCMSTGQAAGTAAALAVEQGISPRNIQTDDLQKILIEQGVIL